MNLNIKKNIPLKDLTTFKAGGRAQFYVEVRNKSELLGAVRYAKDKNVPVFVLGGGSDILVSDHGFKGLVIKFTGKRIKFKDEGKHVLVNAQAGVVWDELVKKCVEHGLYGIECLSGIPGSVGAAPIQNIGAYGQEIKDVFVSLNAYDFKRGEFVKLNKKDCKFSYRESVFKRTKYKGRYLIIDITLKLKKEGKPTLKYRSLLEYLKEKDIKEPTLKQVRNAVLELRGQKLEDPNVLGNAGSFFKNPIIKNSKAEKLEKKFAGMPSYDEGDGKVKLYAGWLIEKAGWKGKKFKNAKVSEKNALVITNPGGKASAKVVKELAEEIAKDVEKKFGIKLEPEVQYIGFD